MGLRSFMAVFGEGDVGLFVALSSFTKDAERPGSRPDASAQSMRASCWARGLRGMLSWTISRALDSRSSRCGSLRG